MKYLDQNFDFSAEGSEDIVGADAAMRGRLSAIMERLREMPPDVDALQRAHAVKESALLQVQLEEYEVAWQRARPILDVFVAHEQWEAAVQVCDILFRSGQAESLAALGHGVWLAVTFPIDPELSVAMLRHIVHETPDDSDGAAVAAAAAAYVVDLRCRDDQRETLSFFTLQMLGEVARRHSQIEDQTDFDAWMLRMELADPGKFLVRLRNIIDVLVQDDWWFDRDAIQTNLPFN